MKLAKTGNFLVVSGMTESQYYRILRVIKDEPGMRYHSQWHAFMIPARIRVYEKLTEISDLAVDPRLIKDVAFAKRERADLPDALRLVEKVRAMKEYDFRGYKFKTTPWEHQKRGVKLLANCKCLALLWDMRTGKTFAVANTIQYLKYMGQPHKTLVICPKHIRINWVEDVQKHTDLKCLVLGNGTSQQLKRLQSADTITVVDGPKVSMRPGKPDLFITNTDAIRNKAFCKALAEFGFDIAVADESHCFANNTKRTHGLMEIKRRVERRYIMTGTLVPKDPSGAYNQMRFVNSSLFPETLEEFKAKYCVYKNVGGREIFLRVNPRTKAELWSRIDRLADKVRIEDCHDMPEKLYTTVDVDLSPEQEVAHSKLLEELCVEIDQGCIATTTLLKSRKLTQVTSGFLYDEEKKSHRFKTNPKLEALRDILVQVAKENRKIIVWAYFHESILMIQELLIEMEIGHSVISGKDDKLTMDERFERLWNFQHKKEATVILANPAMLGLGVDLSVAKYSVFFENDFRLDFRIQAEARNYGDKAKALHGGRIVIYDILARNSIDLLVKKAISCKKNFLDYINAKRLKELKGGFDE